MLTMNDYLFYQVNLPCSITDEVTTLYDSFKFGVAIAKIMECVQMVCYTLQ